MAPTRKCVAEPEGKSAGSGATPAEVSKTKVEPQEPCMSYWLTNVPYISENEKQYFTCYTLYHLAFQPMALSGGHRDLAAACLTC